MLNKKILIVDDIFANRLLLSVIAEEINCSYAFAKDGREAVNCLEDSDYDIVLMDIEMPVMNGIETAMYIRNVLNMDDKELPIIALTAHNIDDYKQEIGSAGFNEVLTKPYLSSRIGELVDKYCI